MDNKSKRDKQYGNMNKKNRKQKRRSEDWDKGFRERAHREKRNERSDQIRSNDLSHMESED